MAELLRRGSDPYAHGGFLFSHCDERRLDVYCGRAQGVDDPSTNPAEMCPGRR
jgi:hypothetical protein